MYDTVRRVMGLIEISGLSRRDSGVWLGFRIAYAWLEAVTSFHIVTAIISFCCPRDVNTPKTESPKHLKP